MYNESRRAREPIMMALENWGILTQDEEQRQRLIHVCFEVDPFYKDRLLVTLEYVTSLSKTSGVKPIQPGRSRFGSLECQIRSGAIRQTGRHQGRS